MNSPALPTTTDDLAQLRGSATRIETPCGDGSVVWHCWGDTGEPVVLLHGGSGSWTHWVRNVSALTAHGRMVIAPDLPGFGDSSLPPDGRDGDVMPRWLNDGLNQIIGDRACAVVGFSFGAMVGTLMASQFPERVNQLVLVGAPALSEVPMPRMGLRSWDHIDPGAQRDDIHHYNLSALMFANPDRIDELAIRLHEKNIERDRLRSRRLPRTNIVVRTLPEVRCPVAGIWGQLDAVYHERSHTIEPALNVAPDYRGLTVIADAGHWVQYEYADQFNQALVQTLT